jgi:hypothetical protein
MLGAFSQEPMVPMDTNGSQLKILTIGGVPPMAVNGSQ